MILIKDLLNLKKSSMSDNSKAPGCIEGLMYYVIFFFIVGCLFIKDYQDPLLFFTILGFIVLLYVITQIIKKD